MRISSAARCDYARHASGHGFMVLGAVPAPLPSRKPKQLCPAACPAVHSLHSYQRPKRLGPDRTYASAVSSDRDRAWYKRLSLKA